MHAIASTIRLTAGVAFAIGAMVIGPVAMQAQQPAAPAASNAAAQAQTQGNTHAGAQSGNAAADQQPNLNSQADKSTDANASAGSQTDQRDATSGNTQANADAEASQDAQASQNESQGSQSSAAASGQTNSDLGIQLNERNGRLMVSSVASSSAIGALQAKDEIIAINGHRIATRAQFNSQLQQARAANGPITFTVVRNGQMQTVRARLSDNQANSTVPSPPGTERTERNYRGQMDNSTQKGASQKGAMQKSYQKPTQKPTQKATQKGGTAPAYGARRQLGGFYYR